MTPLASSLRSSALPQRSLRSLGGPTARFLPEGEVALKAGGGGAPRGSPPAQPSSTAERFEASGAASINGRDSSTIRRRNGQPGISFLYPFTIAPVHEFFRCTIRPSARPGRPIRR